MDRMKKRWILLIVLAVTVITIFVCNIFILPSGSVSIDNTKPKNEYNNYISSGNLIKLNGKLYYNYQKSVYNYGLIEISNKDSRRIYWDNIHWLGTDILLESIRTYDDKIIKKNRKTNKYEIYDFNKNEFVNDEFLNSFDNLKSDFQYYKNRMFFVSSDELSSGKIFCCCDKCKKVIVDKNVFKFYVANDKIYYIVANENSKSISFELSYYDLNRNINEKIVDLNGNSCTDFFVNESFAIIGLQTNNGDELKVVNLDKKTTKTIIENNTEINSINVYKDNVYISENNGIKIINLINNSEKTLYKKCAKECYLFDDEWVYFVGKNSKLYRLNQITNSLEKVFG